MSRRHISRISIDRARLHSGKSPIRVQFAGRSVRHANTVALLGPSVISAVRIRGKNFVFLITEDEVRLVK